MEELIYTEHHAGVYEDGLQICTLCGAVLIDFVDVDCYGDEISGLPEGVVYVANFKKTMHTQIDKPLRSYGDDDPYVRKVVKCVHGNI